MGYLTAQQVAAVVDPDVHVLVSSQEVLDSLAAGDQVLVVNQRGLSWSLPKGHIEEGEDALDAARREAVRTGRSGVVPLQSTADHETGWRR